MTLVGASTSAARAVATPAYPLDARLGLEGFLSPRAERLACLAAASWSFDVAASRQAQGDRTKIGGLRRVA